MKENKDISLWVLVDNKNKIYYTAYSQELLESKQDSFPNIPNLRMVELKGEEDVREKSNNDTK